MSLDGNHHSIQFQVYRGTLDLLLKQCMNVFSEASSCGIVLNIKPVFNDHVTNTFGSTCDETHTMENYSKSNSIDLPGLPIIVKPVQQKKTVGKWNKNRNLEYVIKKEKKNTKKKIRKERELRTCTKTYCAHLMAWYRSASNYSVKGA